MAITDDSITRGGRQWLQVSLRFESRGWHGGVSLWSESLNRHVSMRSLKV